MTNGRESFVHRQLGGCNTKEKFVMLGQNILLDKIMKVTQIERVFIKQMSWGHLSLAIKLLSRRALSRVEVCYC